MSDDAHPHEIIIVKRHGGGHEDGHHGGAWKIAYADFVTAMMAFFLVMWLISANDKTKAVIARYFNPVQLVDSTPQPPGMTDPKDKSANVAKAGSKPPPEPKDGKEAPAEGAKPAAKPEKAGGTAPEGAKSDGGKPEAAKPESAKPDAAKAEAEKAKKEAELMADPVAALNEIASKEAAAQVRPRVIGRAQAEAVKGGAGAAGARGGEAFRDPFAPMSPSASGDSAEPAPDVPDATALPAPPGPAPAATAAAAPLPEPAPPASGPLPTPPAARAAELKSRIEAVMKAVAAADASPGPKLDVKATPEGTLIALTDDARFSMFGSASAEPSPSAVALMARIGKLLKEQKGRIVIRGFTDSRKYKSPTYDNWRLSAARAHMAHYMLMRGGLDDARFERIEGYADRQPRLPKDPESPENRRIEILVREP